MIDEFKDSGGQNAIWLALAAVVRDHPDPRHAVQVALNAVEAERVRQLHSTQQLSAWEQGFVEAQESLIQRLSSISGELPQA